MYTAYERDWDEQTEDVLVEESDLAARDVEAFLLGLRKEGALVLRELRVVDEGVGGVVVLGGMIALRRDVCVSTEPHLEHN